MQDLGMEKRNPRMPVKSSRTNLYWVTTEDHDEDWFILARTAQTARRFHTDYEGYEPDDAHAELILRAVEDQIPGPIPRHAQLEDLQKVGFEVLNPDPNGRIVRLAGRTFVEGLLESLLAEASDNAWEAQGEGRPHGTKRPWKN